MNSYTEEELKELKEVVGSMTHLQEHQSNFIWNNYKRIANTNERQPCFCKASAGLWAKAVNTIRQFLDDK